MDVTEWLRALGLEEHAPAFRENLIDDRVLPSLTAEDLKELGVTAVGSRRRILDAIALLRGQTLSVEVGETIGAARENHRGSEVGEAERRQVTALFCDLVGSTPLSGRLDPEDLRGLIATYYERATEVIGKFGGYVGQYSGDGLMAYFGYPLAHEDDAERAVRAGLAVVDSVRQIAGPERLQVRVGIATGLVVTGAILGAPRGGGAVGETLNVAARLQTLAPPDNVVIAKSTHALIGGLFEYENLGPQELKGLSRPVNVWRVVSEGTAASRFDALRADFRGLPLIGRGDELALLLQCWERVQGGAGQVVLLSGEPGIGKSRLIAALHECTADRSHWRLSYFCSPHYQDSALHPIIAQLQRAAAFERGDTAEEKWAKLGAVLTPNTTSQADVALLGDLLSLPRRDDPEVGNMTAQERRQRTIEALYNQLIALARQRPVLMVFEDIHWADPSTCDLLDRIIGNGVFHRALILLTYRPEFQPPPWVRLPDVCSVSLNRLNRHEGAALVREISGAGRALPEYIIEEIVSRTDGVPLFLEELARAALEVDIAPGAVPQVIASAPPLSTDVPASLYGSLLARLDRLGPIARETAQIGAAIGREFGLDLLIAVAGRTGPELETALDRLTEAGLVFRRGGLSEANFLFKHALIQDVAYNTLLRARRRQLHGAIARTLVDQFPEQWESEPELLANHFTEAGEVDQALSYWLKAGRRSAERSADREAVNQLQRGLNLLATLPESNERDRLEVTFQLTLGTPLMSVYSYTAPQVAAVYQRASVLCQRLGDTEGLIMTIHALRAHQMVRGETRASVRLAEQCLSVTESYEGRDYRLLSYYGLGTSRMQLGELQQARTAFERVVALYDPERDHSLAARCIFDPRAAALALVSPVMWALGYSEQARRTGDRALGFAVERAHAHTSGLTRFFAGGLLAELLNDVSGAWEHARTVVALADQHNMPAWHANGTILLGWATARRGNLVDGTSLVQRGLSELDAIGTVWQRPHHLGILAELHAQRGDHSASLQLIGEARRYVRMIDAYFWHADICRIEGELRRQAGASDGEVEGCFTEAIEVAQQQMAKSFELRAAMRMAGLWRDQGRLVDARNLLLPLYNWFTEGLDTSDLRAAKMLLDELH